MYCSLIPSPSDIEVVSIKLGLTKEIVICCVYVPPDSSPTYVSSLVTYLTSLISSFERCIFVDDFNFPDIDWSYLSNYFCEYIFDCNLSQHLMESTHIKGNILDLVLTSPSVSIRELTIHSSFSDHFVVSFVPYCYIPFVVESKPCYVLIIQKLTLMVFVHFC